MEDRFRIVYIAENADGQYKDYTFWAGNSIIKLLWNFFSMLANRDHPYVKVVWRVR